MFLYSVPKPLLDICGIPLITHWLNLLHGAGINNSQIYIITNGATYPLFVEWAKQQQVIHTLYHGQ